GRQAGTHWMGHRHRRIRHARPAESRILEPALVQRNSEPLGILGRRIWSRLALVARAPAPLCLTKEPFMKRCITVVVAMAAVSAFAQTTFDQNLRLERPDGTEALIAPAPVVTQDVIVEFRDAPLSVARARVGKAALPDYHATFARFRGDLGSIVSAANGNANRAGKTALEADVRWEYFEVFNGASVRVPRSAIASIARLPYVKRVHDDHEMQAMSGPATVQIGADKVWTAPGGTRGKGVVVAVIDTGVDYKHEALGRGFGPGFKVIGGYDFVNKDNDPLDDAGHGTHVSGIIAGDSATITGVAPEASII